MAAQTPHLISSQSRHQVTAQAHAMTGGGYGGGFPYLAAHPQQPHPHMMAAPHMQNPVHATSNNSEIIFESAGMTLQSTGMVSPETGQTVYRTSLNNGRTTLYLESTGRRDAHGRTAYKNVTTAFTAAMHAQSIQAYNGLQTHR